MSCATLVLPATPPVYHGVLAMMAPMEPEKPRKPYRPSKIMTWLRKFWPWLHWKFLRLKNYLRWGLND